MGANKYREQIRIRYLRMLVFLYGCGSSFENKKSQMVFNINIPSRTKPFFLHILMKTNFLKILYENKKGGERRKEKVKKKIRREKIKDGQLII